MEKLKFLVLSIFLVCILSSAALAQNETMNATQQLAWNAILHAEVEMREMIDSGFSVSFVNDTIILAKVAFEQGNFDEVYRKADMVSDTKQIALLLSDELIALEAKIQRYGDSGLNLTDAMSIYEEARTAFFDEIYDDAEELIEQTHGKLDEIKSEWLVSQTMLEASKRNIVGFIQQNWLWLIVISSILIVSGLLGYGKFKVIMAEKKLADLAIEKGVINKLMKKAQKEHYEIKALSSATYKVKMEKYKDRMLKINEEVPALQVQIRRGAIGVITSRPRWFGKGKK